MNYLAHMYLSCTNEDLIIGNMLVDMLPIKKLRTLPERYHQGYELHRLIDSYTDSHPEVKRATLHLRSNHGKYAPVVIDIFYDYVLSQEWDRYHGEPIQLFCDRIYRILEKHFDKLPEDIVGRLKNMIAGNYLMTCSDAKSLQKVFDRVGDRARFANSFSIATDDLLQDYSLYRDSFFQFFPDMIQQVESFCDC